MLHINRGFTIMKQIMMYQVVSNIPVKAIKTNISKYQP